MINYCFRFTNDLGGNVLFGDYLYAEKARIAESTTGTLSAYHGFKAYYPLPYGSFASGTSSADDYSGKINMSNYIAYNTNAEMSDPLLKYDKVTSIDRENSAIRDQIGEFSVVNEDGKTYIYGLPVYSKSERSYNYFINGVQCKIENRDRVTTNSVLTNGENGTISDLKKVGQSDDTPYANNYLLTAILDQDYVDVDNDGPDEDDLGGWVKFSYEKVFGDQNINNDNTWYKWRMPYSGLNYMPNDVIENIDDMGAVSMGYKEVYYLKSIETKTHVAEFNLKKRNDCLPANELENKAVNGQKR